MPNVPVTGGSGFNIATNTVTRDAVTEQLQLFNLSDSTGLNYAAVSSAGALTANIQDSIGQVQYNFPAGFQRTTDEPRQIFYDPFDAALDTTNRWTAPTSSGGGVGAAVATGNLTLATGTTASGYSYLQSAASITPVVPAWLGNSHAIKVENPVLTNAYRFWGMGTNPGTPTTAAPLTDAIGFELYTDGKLYAVVYAAGVRTVIQDLSAATGNSKQPTDALFHRYICYARTDRMYWYIDSLATPVATSSFQAPNVQTLPVKFLAVAGTTPPTSSAVITVSGLAVWDTGKNSTQISDGTYPWRKATVNSSGAMSVSGTFWQATQPVSLATNTPVIAAGTAIIGKVTTDQTTHGTTDLVASDNIKWGGATLGAATAIGTGAAGNVLAVQGVLGGVAQPYTIIPKTTTITTTLLGANGVYTQTGVDTNADGNTEVHVSALSSIGGSAVNGFTIQTSDDNVTWTTIAKTTVTAAVVSLLTAAIYQRYWRMVYTNGATAQTGTFAVISQIDVGFVPVMRPYTGYSGVAIPVISINDATNTTAYSAAATTVIKATSGRLVSILVTTAGTAACNIYDNASAASGTIIGIVAANTTAGTVLVFAAPAANGITVGGVVSNCAFTVMWN